MSLFDLFKSDPEADARREAFLVRQKASIQSLKNGGLPLDATERLTEQRARQNTPGHLWTSDLSVSELLLSRGVGFEPLGQVLGASTYHVGLQWRNQLWRQNVWQNGALYELDVVTQAYAHARQLALGRLQQEAALLGADGVVGVRIERRRAGWADDLVEFSALGTAIRLENRPPREKGAPFLCNLSGQEFWKLLVSGFEPMGVVAGNSSFLCVTSLNTHQMLRGGWLNLASWQNSEVAEFTQTTFQARETAQRRLTDETRTLGASGTVGMQIEHETHFEEIELSSGNSNNKQRESMVFHFFALGTAIRPSTHAISKQLARGLTILPLKKMSR